MTHHSRANRNELPGGFSTKASRPLTAFGSRGVSFIPMLKPTSAGAVCMRVEPGGMIAEHPAAANQLFLVVEGEGWVRSAPDGPVHIEAGQAAFWKQGEKHEAGSATGLVAVIIEGAGLQPELPPIG